MNSESKLVFLDCRAWQLSTEEIETSDLVFNGGEDGAVHLKLCPLQYHSFVNMALLQIDIHQILCLFCIPRNSLSFLPPSFLPNTRSVLHSWRPR